MHFLVQLSLVSVAAVAILTWRYLSNRGTKSQPVAPATLDEKKDVDPYDAIKPMQGDENWATTPPIKLRPFKPKYHMTMGELTVISKKNHY